jgi:hypothetical protein
LKNRQTTLAIVVTVIFVSLASVIGILAYRFGQQAATGESESALSTVVVSPTPTDVLAKPPVIVTNTPTVTSSPTATPGPTDTPTPTPTPLIVITHVNSLGRLETTEFAMQTVVDLENEPTNMWERIFGTDQLMLVAEGEVVAGIDLDKVAEEDIVVRGTTVNITLPSPEILYSRIDNERSYVYERNTGLFRPIDKTLEARARLLAEQSMVDWAIQRDIYGKAADSARVRVENLLRSLGFTEIVIQFRSEPI